MNRYPDMGCGALYAALADRLGVRTDTLTAATGSVALIYQILQTFCDPGDEVVHAWRSFEAYPIAVAAAGAVGVSVAASMRAALYGLRYAFNLRGNPPESYVGNRSGTTTRTPASTR